MLTLTPQQQTLVLTNPEVKNRFEYQAFEIGFDDGLKRAFLQRTPAGFKGAYGRGFKAGMKARPRIAPQHPPFPSRSEVVTMLKEEFSTTL